MANAHTVNSFAEKSAFFLYHLLSNEKLMAEHSSQLEQKKLLHIALGPALLCLFLNWTKIGIKSAVCLLLWVLHSF
jgi:hypothetical protein